MFERLPVAVSIAILCQWCSLNDQTKIDTAFCVKFVRNKILGFLSHAGFVLQQVNTSNPLKWLMLRNIKFSELALMTSFHSSEYISENQLLNLDVSKLVKH